MAVIHVSFSWKFLTVPDLQGFASNYPPCLCMGEEAEVLNSCWNSTQLLCGVFLQIVNRLLQIWSTAQVSGSPDHDITLSFSPHLTWVQQSSCNHAALCPSHFCSEGTMGFYTVRRMNPANPATLRPGSLSPWYCLLLCELTALIRTCSEISGLPFVAGWRHAVSKGFFWVWVFPLFRSSKITTMPVSCCSMGLPFVKKTHQLC